MYATGQEQNALKPYSYPISIGSAGVVKSMTSLLIFSVECVFPRRKRSSDSTLRTLILSILGNNFLRTNLISRTVIFFNH